MEYFELTVTVLVKKDIYYQKVQESIGNYLSLSMLLNEKLKQIHGQKGHKGYCFSGLYPIEMKTKVYKAGAVYVFRVRSLKEVFLDTLDQCLRKVKSDQFNCISIEKRKYRNRIVQELYSATPFILTIDGQPWLQETGDFDLLIKRLEANARKKYEDAFNQKIENEHFIQRLEIINQKPIAVAYKGIRLLGNKLRITVNTDDESQKLAYTVLGSSIGEKGSSLGAGFCFANFI